MPYPNQTPTVGESEYDIPQAPITGQPGSAWDSPASADGPARQVAEHTGDRVKDVAGTAQDEVIAVTDTAKDAGGHVVDTAKQEAGQVLEEVKFQGRRLLDESMSEFRSQTATGQHQIAELARALGGELKTMSQADEGGMLGEYVDKAQQFSDDAAAWLDSKQPEEVLASVRRYAARNPVQFLAISAGVGFIGARIFRGLQGAKADADKRVESTTEFGRPMQTSGTYSTPLADDYSLSTLSATTPRRESSLGNATFVPPQSQTADLTREGGDPWREGLR